MLTAYCSDFALCNAVMVKVLQFFVIDSSELTFSHLAPEASILLFKAFN